MSEEIGFWYIFAGTSPKCRIIVSQKETQSTEDVSFGKIGPGALLVGCSCSNEEFSSN